MEWVGIATQGDNMTRETEVLNAPGLVMGFEVRRSGEKSWKLFSFISALVLLRTGSIMFHRGPLMHFFAEPAQMGCS